MWAWFMLYMGSSFFVEIFMPKRFANGLTGKITKKWIKKQYPRHVIRYYGWLGVFGMICRPSWGHNTPIWAIFWLIACLFILDDYIFGNDNDWKKRWESVKNKIKWKMELPVPETQDVRGA